jgi:hypothetical protein
MLVSPPPSPSIESSLAVILAVIVFTPLCIHIVYRLLYDILKPRCCPEVYSHV